MRERTRSSRVRFLAVIGAIVAVALLILILWLVLG